MQPWARAADGSAQLVFSKPFDSPAQATAIIKELNGTVGPLRDVTVTRDAGSFSTSYATKGTLDLKDLDTGLTTDPDVVGSLLGQSVDAGAVDQSLLADLRDSFGLTVKVEQPGGTTVVAGRTGSGDARRRVHVGARHHAGDPGDDRGGARRARDRGAAVAGSASPAPGYPPR